MSTPDGFGSVSVAASMRDTIVNIATGVINKLRPAPFYGTVISIQPDARTCEVQPVGDSSSMIVRCGAIQPPFTGITVKVEGIQGDKWVTQILGTAYFPGISPSLVGSWMPLTYANGFGALFLGPDDENVFVDLSGGTFDCTLPVSLSVQKGKTYTILNGGPAGICRVVSVGAEHFYPNGSTPISLNPGESVTICADQGQWLVLHRSQTNLAWHGLTYGTNIDSFNVIAGGTTYFDPGCRFEGTGIRLKGLLIATANIAASSVIATLPSGMRPARASLHNVMATTNVAARLDIAPDGTMTCAPALLSGAYVSLDGITFPLANS